MAAFKSRVRTGQSPPYRTWSSSSKLLACFVVLAAAWMQVSMQQSSPQSDKAQEVNDELRILLVGKTGAGKSATGNTILRKKAFVSEFSSSSVTSQCEKFDEVVNGRKVTVIDSPGVFDTNLSSDEVIGRIKLCIPLSAPGPHVFLVVIKLGRFTEEEKKTVKLFQLIFGEESSRYTMVLFTHGDQLKGKSIHQFVRDSPELLDFVKEHSGRYHVFNNEDQDPGQVIQLLDQIDKMVTVNGGGHYTTEMLQETERAIEEEKRRILKENRAQRQKEIDELRSQKKGYEIGLAIEELKMKHEREARRKAERSDSLFDKIKKFLYRIYDTIYEFFERFFESYSYCKPFFSAGMFHTAAVRAVGKLGTDHHTQKNIDKD